MSIYLLLLFVVPADLVVPGFGAAGAPASLLAFGVALWYIASVVHPDGQRAPGVNPVRLILIGYFAVVLLSWTNGKTRVLTALEASTSDRAMINIVGLLGIALVLTDGLRSWEEIETIVRRMVQLSMAMVVVGLLQFFLRLDLTRYMDLPGLAANTSAQAIPTRSIFNRPFGTALHPIEYGVVSAALVPLALRTFVRSKTVTTFAWLSLLAFASLASISRSAVLCLGVAGAVTFLGSSWRARVNLGGAGLVFVVVAGSVVPGLVGTLRSLFTSAGTDPSVQARRDRVPRVLELIAEHPWMGRGYGTFTPEEYLLLDNEIQKLAIESGMIGVAGLIAFIAAVVWVAMMVRHYGPDQRSLGTALIAAILSISVSSYTFDAFFYHILSGILYICIGLVGAAWRLGVVHSADASGTMIVRDGNNAALRLRIG